MKALYSSVAELWHPELRYRAKDPTVREAERFCKEVFHVYRWVIEQAL
jgi:hypothetical protein